MKNYIMSVVLPNLAIGMGSILLPSLFSEAANQRVTILPNTASDAVAGDFRTVAGDLSKSLTTAEKATQLELAFCPA
jgi:hypothetical protein